MAPDAEQHGGAGGGGQGGAAWGGLAPLRSWPWALGIVIIWLVAALGWSYFLIAQSFDHTIQERLVERATQIAAALRERLPEAALQTGNHGGGGTGGAANCVGDPALQQHVQWEARHDRYLAYLMLWDRGVVVAHSRAEMPGRTLPPGIWPPLDPSQTPRTESIHNGDLPWSANGANSGTRAEVSAGGREEGVLEVTVPLQAGPRPLGFVSLGLYQSQLHELFWSSQRPLFGAALAVALAGCVVILIGLEYDRRRRHRALVIQAQNLRARTSLLTERGMLASILAHEVRSPLTALRFNLHSLRSLLEHRSTDSDRQLELTDLCGREIRRLDLMLHDFLTRTQVVSQVENTPVNQVVREALDFLQPTLEQKNIKAVTHLDGANPLVSVNADELRQVLLNLAANAQDALSAPKPPGGGAGREGNTLVISTVAEADSVTMLVRDNGVGIPEDAQERIFEPFFSTKPQGSGLGLALVRRVISGAGGTVFCESVVGEGTTFRIVLPRALPGQQSEAHEE